VSERGKDTILHSLDLTKIENEQELLAMFERAKQAREDEKRERVISEAKGYLKRAIFGRYGGTMLYEGNVEVNISESFQELKGRVAKMDLRSVQSEIGQLERFKTQCEQFPKVVEQEIAKHLNAFSPSERDERRKQETAFWDPKLKTISEAVPYVEKMLDVYRRRLEELQPLVQNQDQFLNTMRSSNQKAKKIIAEIQKLLRETWLNKPERNIENISNLLYEWYKQSLTFEKAKEEYVLAGGSIGSIPEFPKNPLDSFLFNHPLFKEVERKYMELIREGGG
jgi:hypothetical protein